MSGLSEMFDRAQIPGTSLKSERPPTPEQDAIFSHATDCPKNLIVRARAGTGKTTAIVGTCRRIKPHKRVIVFAFNTGIADELKTKSLPPNVFVSTVHGFCWRAILRASPTKPELDKHKTTKMLREMMGGDTMNAEDLRIFGAIHSPMKRLISIMKNQGFGALKDLPTAEDALALSFEYDIELPDNGDQEKLLDILPKLYKASIERRDLMDFDDMVLYVPLYNVRVFKHDYVLVDEAQDLNAIQVDIIKRASGGGKVIFVGDDRQAIYLFRGAGSNVLPDLETQFRADVLGLTVCWRCPKTVIKLAQAIVPDIQHAPDAIEGEVKHIQLKDFVDATKTGHYVLCRNTAPLIGQCMKIIAKGRKAMVKGRDIGENLVTLLANVAKKYKDKQVLDGIETYCDAELSKLDKPEHEKQREAMSDKRDCLVILSEGCETYDAVKQKIDSIFTDDEYGVVFSTVHKAKGLEAEVVHILEPGLLGNTKRCRTDEQAQQEKNLEYVAITRAMRELIFVKSPAKKSQPSK